MGLILTFVYYLAFFDDGSKLTAQITSQNQQISEIEKKIVEKKKEIQAFETFKQAKTELGARFDQLIKYIPEDFNSNEETRILVREARASGANIVEIKKNSSAGQTFKFYEEILVDVKLEGNYSQIILFLSNLTKQDKVIAIQKMEMKSKRDGVSADSTIIFSAVFVGYKQTQSSNKGEKG